MDEALFYMIQNAVKEMSVKEGVLANEQGTLLRLETISLVKEIEQNVHEMAIESLIDQALATNDKELFMQLTTR